MNAGIYTIDGPVYIGSNSILAGDSDAVIKVSSGSSQWFTGRTGIVCTQEPVDNVTISGFQIDGNCNHLSNKLADSRPDTDYDCERAIIIRGDSNRPCNNVIVQNMKVYNCFSDGIHIEHAINAQCANNFISNCQHSGIFLICVEKGLVEGNDVAGIVSDCLRYDNCVDNVFRKNTFYSYTGPDSNGAYQKGENGVQIADEGYSHGGGTDFAMKTKNIEGYENTFANTGLRAVWVDSTGKGVENVYLHDNKFLTGEELETNGISVQGISFTNPPTKETSEEIFSSIFDILSLNITAAGSATSEHEQTQKEVISVHEAAVKSMEGKPLIPPINLVFSVIVGIFAIGIFKVLKVIL